MPGLQRREWHRIGKPLGHYATLTGLILDSQFRGQS